MASNSSIGERNKNQEIFWDLIYLQQVRVFYAMLKKAVAKDNRHVITGETLTCKIVIVVVVNLLTGECFILTSSFELHFEDQSSKPNVQSLLIPNLLY